jgi:two-component system sensor histidine kinase TctE
LLTLARAEPNARVRDALPFDLRAAAFEASSHWVPKALQAGMDLGFEDPAVVFGAKSPEALQVVGNAELLAEALHNLIDNAIVYGRPGGRITVSVRPAGGERVQIRVDDDGPGIPEGDRERVLQRFHRGRHTPRADGRSAHGAGLGLAIVSDIARAHGGEVRIADGETGRGTCVIIELPRWTGQGVEYLAEPKVVPASNEPRASGLRLGDRTPADAV